MNLADTFGICSVTDAIGCKRMPKCVKMKILNVSFVQIGMKFVLISAWIHGRCLIQYIRTGILIGKKKGDTVKVEAPVGEIEYTVVSVKND